MNKLQTRVTNLLQQVRWTDVFHCYTVQSLNGVYVLHCFGSTPAHWISSETITMQLFTSIFGEQRKTRSPFYPGGLCLKISTILLYLSRCVNAPNLKALNILYYQAASY